MVKKISDRCWAAIVRELIEAYYLKESTKSYREIAEDVYDKKYCSDRPSPRRGESSLRIPAVFGTT